MKILISLSLLFISCIVCKGQNKKLDSIFTMMRDSGIATYGIGNVTTLYKNLIDADSIWLSSDSTKYYYRVEKPKTDTVSVILLCSDTSLKKGFYTFSIFQNSKDSTENVATVKNRVPYVFWIFGYLVIEYNDYMSLEYYLDANKNKLWKNIIVWKYIEIE